MIIDNYHLKKKKKGSFFCLLLFVGQGKGEDGGDFSVNQSSCSSKYTENTFLFQQTWGEIICQKKDWVYLHNHKTPWIPWQAPLQRPRF